VPAAALPRLLPLVDLVPDLQSLREDLRLLEMRLVSMPIPTVPILRDLPAGQRRRTHLHVRGSFLNKGEAVEPGVPDVLGPWPEGAPANRLGLARWLVSGDNPLTGRVLVNRLWEQLFGRGLVVTSGDFGTQGEPPTHPQLLDWLACELYEGGWSLKAILRTIVTSATYRQSSSATPQSLARDPDNRWLGRGPRFRLPAEMVRDQALAVSGLLSSRLLGPSVMPPQPDGIWINIYSDERWTESMGEDRYRRALYTFWRRTAPYPALETFDAPSREVCVVYRQPSNTPLQALVTLNDPAFVEAAGALARRTLAAAADAEGRAAWLIGNCLVRGAEPRETRLLAELAERQREHYAARPEQAQELVREARQTVLNDAVDLAAWIIVANVVLNLDELLVKG
jgi:hypothetical protein